MGFEIGADETETVAFNTSMSQLVATEAITVPRPMGGSKRIDPVQVVLLKYPFAVQDPTCIYVLDPSRGLGSH